MSSKALAGLGMRLSACRSANNTMFRVTSVGGSSRWTNRDLSTVNANSSLDRRKRNDAIFFLRPRHQHTVASEDKKTAAGDAVEEHEFQAETRQLLDIVARSLYSEKEVFVRELISNASDAIEKFRYLQVTEGSQALADPSRQGRIEITTDKANNTFTVSDNGIGMTKDDMISNLGTIARSGSKAFMAELEQGEKGGDPEAIIGQFGVGFYSASMVADKIDVVSLHGAAGSKPYRWSSDGSGKYTVVEASDVVAASGTSVTVHLKPDCSEFSDENRIKEVIKKYSSFVGSQVALNGNLCNDLRPVWLMDPKEVDEETHDRFYRHVANAVDKPRFVHHFRVDTPVDVRALLYVPETRPGLFETGRDSGDGGGVALYCRKILVKSKTADNSIVPKWMRFVKGVVDSEDVPLNLSREILQDGAQIRKIRKVVTNRFLRFLGDKAKKDQKSFLDFYKDYGFFFKEGIITSAGGDQYEKEEIAKLLRFDSSASSCSEAISLADYCGRMRPGQRDIYYLAAPSRQLAESSPYYEALRKKDVEVLFCYEPHDELVLMQLQQFDKKNLRSVEKEMREDPEDEASDDDTELTQWMRMQLSGKAASVKVTKKLRSHPCVVTVQEMAAARHFVKTQGSNFTEEQRHQILQPQLEINPDHPIVKKIDQLRTSVDQKQLAVLVTDQLFLNAMVEAGLILDPRTILKSMNPLLEAALEKH